MLTAPRRFTARLASTFAAALLLSGLVVAPPAARAQDASSGVTKYQYFPFDVPASLGSVTIPRAVNNKGAIAGRFFNPSTGNLDGFLYEQGKFTDVVVPASGSVVTTLRALNNNGEAVGQYATTADDSVATHLFRRANNGTVTLIPDPVAGSEIYAPYQINDFGTVVGYYFDANFNQHGFILDKAGHCRTYDYPGSAGGTSLGGINNAGQMTGSYLDANFHPHGFLLDNNLHIIRTIDNPAARATVPLNLNNAGQTVGYDFRGPSYQRGQGFLLDLNTGGFSPVMFPATRYYTTCFGINDAGLVVGNWIAADGTEGGFLAVPVASL